MRVAVFSSFTFGYLDRARVLFESIKKFHSDWHTYALITDVMPKGFSFENIENFDEIVYSNCLEISRFQSWLFKHDVVEACTAVKGPFLADLLKKNYDAVLYLDPDVCLFNSLESIIDELKNYSIILTPHQLAPDRSLRTIIDNEITSLKTGIYNLGFIAVKCDAIGLEFSEWWSERLLNFCYDDVNKGLFVDQRWCDHVPVFFDKVLISKDPGLNVASWNLSQRKITFNSNGDVESNGRLLKFWHFTKLGPLGDVMTRRYARDNTEVYELWNWYKRRVNYYQDEHVKNYQWFYSSYDDGSLITANQRSLYRNRVDLQRAFEFPFLVGENSYFTWYKNNM